jgi:hypothetical protein
MALSGPEALRSIEEALRDIRREEDEISKRLARSAERVAKFRESEAELFRQLAAVRLDPAIQAELNGQLSAAELKARQMLAEHSGALNSIEDKLQAYDAEIATLTAERSGLVQSNVDREAELKALSSRIGAALAADPDYAGKRRHAEEQEAVADESADKTAQAEADRERKGRPYRDDRLFMYLWERGYGTDAYKAGNLTRALDGWVAGLVGYHKARPNFLMLNEIPLRLKEHADRQAADAVAAAAAVTALETAAIDTAGGKPVRQALAAGQARIAEIDRRIAEIEDLRDAQTEQQRRLAEGGDPAFSRATAELAQSLGREDLQNLLAEARRTSTGQDDTIIAQIDDARTRAREEETETRGQKERLRVLASRRKELEDIEWEFKKARFDDPRSTFRQDSLAGDVLNDFLRGTITASTYWTQWQNSQSWRGGGSAPRAPSAPSGGGGGFSWPDSSFSGGGSRRASTGGSWGKLPGMGSGNSGGGGFSRPRTGSKGSRPGGGFKTGGGF